MKKNRKADKKNRATETVPQPDYKADTEQYVLDGGSLLHRGNCESGQSYGDIAKSHASFTSFMPSQVVTAHPGFSTSQK